MATGMILATKKGRTGIRYLLGAENLRLSDWLNILSQETKQPIPRCKIHDLLAFLVAWLSEVWADHISGNSESYDNWGTSNPSQYVFDSSMNPNELGLHPRPIREPLVIP